MSRPPRVWAALTLAFALPFWLTLPMAFNLLHGSPRALFAAWGPIWIALTAGLHLGIILSRSGGIWLPLLAALPIPYAFFFIQGNAFGLPGQSSSHLVIALLFTLILDLFLQTRGYAPKWWALLRLVTGGVTLASIWILRSV